MELRSPWLWWGSALGGLSRAQHLPLDVFHRNHFSLPMTCPEPALVMGKHGENVLQSNWERNLRPVLLRWLLVASDQEQDPHGTAAIVPVHTLITHNTIKIQGFFNMLIGTFIFDSLFGILAIPYG